MRTAPRGRRRRRRGRFVLRLLVFVLGLATLSAMLPTLFIAVRCLRPGAASPPRPPEVEQLARTIRGYARPGAATFLAIPEWYVVYSTDEYAEMLSTQPPSRFPYLTASRQYWDYYGAMCQVTRSGYAFDPRVHLRLGLTGVSFSAENLVKAAWENTLGRLTERLASQGTEEDAFAQRTAAEYARFMHGMPWYEFPFGGVLLALWRETPLRGEAPVRKLERRVALSAEYGAKAINAWIARRATGASVPTEGERIHAWVTGPAEAILADERVQRVADAAPGVVVALPRDEAFTDVVRDLLTRGGRLRDVAGNDIIALTVVVKGPVRLPAAAGEVVFNAPILTEPDATRVVLLTAVSSLHMVLPAIERAGARLERLYDY